MVTDLPEIDDFGFEVPRPKPKEANTASNRPIARVARGAVEELKDTIFSGGTLLRLLKSAVPPGIAHTIDDVETAVDVGSNLMDSVTETIGPELSAFKRNVRRLMPSVKEYVPASVSEKIEKAVEPPPDEDADNYERYDPDAETISATLRDVFNAERIQESFYRDEDEARETVRDGVQRKFNAANLNALDAIRKNLEEAAEHRDSVAVRRDQKLLELQYRQYFTQRDLLAETVSGNSKVLDQLSAIVANTSLPDIAKVKEYEKREEVRGASITGRMSHRITEYTRNFQTQIHNIISDRVNRFGSSARQALQQVNAGAGAAAQMSSMPKGLMDEIDGMKELGRAGTGYLLDEGLIDSAGKRLGTLLQKIPGLTTLDQQLQFYHNNAPELLSEWAKTKSKGFNIGSKDNPILTGVGARQLDWLKQLIPQYNGGAVDFAAGGYGGSRETVNFDDLTRRSIIETIPGLLSELLQVAHEINGERKERRVYDPSLGKLVDESTLRTSIEQNVLPTDDARRVAVSANKLMGDLGKDITLSTEAKDALRSQLIYDAQKGRRFNPTRWSQEPGSAGLEQITNPVILDELKSLNIDIPIERLNAINASYLAMRETLPTMEESIDHIIHGGGRRQLEQLGILRNGQIDNDYVLRRVANEKDVSSSEPEESDPEEDMPPTLLQQLTPKVGSALKAKWQQVRKKQQGTEESSPTEGPSDTQDSQPTPTLAQRVSEKAEGILSSKPTQDILKRLDDARQTVVRTVSTPTQTAPSGDNAPQTPSEESNDTKVGYPTRLKQNLSERITERLRGDSDITHTLQQMQDQVTRYIDDASAAVNQLTETTKPTVDHAVTAAAQKIETTVKSTRDTLADFTHRLTLRHPTAPATQDWSMGATSGHAVTPPVIVNGGEVGKTFSLTYPVPLYEGIPLHTKPYTLKGGGGEYEAKPSSLLVKDRDNTTPNNTLERGETPAGLLPVNPAIPGTVYPPQPQRTPYQYTHTPSTPSVPVDTPHRIRPIIDAVKDTISAYHPTVSAAPKELINTLRQSARVKTVEETLRDLLARYQSGQTHEDVQNLKQSVDQRVQDGYQHLQEGYQRVRGTLNAKPLTDAIATIAKYIPDPNAITTVSDAVKQVRVPQTKSAADLIDRIATLATKTPEPKAVISNTLDRITQSMRDTLRQTTDTTTDETPDHDGQRATRDVKRTRTVARDPNALLDEDIYVGDEKEPRLTRVGFRAGQYFNATTRRKVKRFKDLGNVIIDGDKNVILSMADYDTGLFTVEGKRIIPKVATATSEWLGRAEYFGQLVGGRVGVLREKFMQGVHGLQGRIDDVYVLGQPDPVITAEKMRQQFYVDRRTKKPIHTIDDIKGAVEDREGNIVLTWDDFDKGLYLKDGTPVHRKGLAYQTGRFVDWYFGGYYRNLWKFITSPSGIPKLLKGIGSRLLGVPDCYVPGEESPRLLARLLRRGMYLSSATGRRIFKLSQIDSDVLGPDGEVVLTLDEAQRGLVDKYGRPVRGLGNRLIRKAFNVATAPVRALGKLYRKTTHALGDMAYRGASTVLGAANRGAMALFDRVTGYRKGSWEDRRYQREQAEKDRQRDGKDTTKPGKEKKTGILGLLLGMAGVVKWGFTKLMDKLNPLSYLKDILNVTKAIRGVGSVLDTLGGSGKSGKILKKGGGLLKRVGSTVLRQGSRVLSTVGRAAVTGLGAEALVSGVGAAAGTAMGAIGSTLAAAGSAVAGFFTLPVVLGAAVVGFGAWYLWRKYGATPDPIQAVRLAEYGIPTDNRDLKAKVLKLEEALKDHVMVREQDAQFKRSIPVKDMYELFDIDPTDAEKSQTFLRWFRDRFRPVYLRFAMVGNQLQKGITVDKLDDKLDDGDKPRLVRETRFKESDPEYPYNVTDSPEPPAPCVTGTVDIDNAIRVVENKYGSAARRKHKEEIKKQRRADNDAVAKNGLTPEESKAAYRLANSPSQAYTTETELRRQEKDTVTHTGGVDAKLFAGSRHQKIDELAAIRYRTYGLTTLDRGRADMLTLLESDLRDELTYRGMGQASIDYSPNEMFETYGPRFELNISNPDHRKKWKTWLTERFMPTFLSYATAVHACASGVALEDASRLLSAEQQYKVAQAVVSAQATGWFINTSVWKCETSPWPDYTLNMDSSSVREAMNTLKARIKKEELEEVKGKNQGESKVGDGSSAANATKTRTLPKDNLANQDSVKKAIENSGGSTSTTLGDVTPKIPTRDGSSGYTGAGGSASTTPVADALNAGNEVALSNFDGGDGPSDEGKYANVPEIKGPVGGGSSGARVAKITTRTPTDYRTLPKSKGDGWSNNREVIVAAAKAVGVDPATMATFAGVESDYRPTATPGTTSAAGLYQFINSTWRSVIEKYGRYYGIKPGTSKSDARANAIMGGELLRENANYLRSHLGREPTDIELYLAHFMGGYDAYRYGKLPENAIPASTMPEKAAANAWVFRKNKGSGPYRTKAEMSADLVRRLNAKGGLHGADAENLFRVMSEGAGSTSAVADKPAMESLTGDTTPASNVTTPTTVESTDLGGNASPAMGSQGETSASTETSTGDAKTSPDPQSTVTSTGAGASQDNLTQPTEVASAKKPYYPGDSINNYVPDGYSDVDYNRTPPPKPVVAPMDDIVRGGVNAVSPTQSTPEQQTMSTIAAQTSGITTQPERAAKIAAAQPVAAQPVPDGELVSIMQNQLTTQQEIRDLVKDLLSMKQTTQGGSNHSTTEHVKGKPPVTQTGLTPSGTPRSKSPITLSRNI